ncbi:hypothetical protein V8G54_013989 [Vigna mungo]|uniref:Uncharacterized protein n=1 Tax=Vigna mungo TaxID=3915 RepID=A0AAQ3RVI2_VIGMU
MYSAQRNSAIRPHRYSTIRLCRYSAIRPHSYSSIDLEGTRLFGLPGIQPVGLATIWPHRFCLLGSSPGTPGSRTTNHVYWEVLQELMGHGRSILSTGKFSRNSWVMDNQSRLLGDGQFCLLGSSPGTPGSRTTNHVYWEVLQELLGHGRSITFTGMFSKNSWAIDGQFRLLGSSLGTPRPRATNLVYWEILQELLGHGQPFMPTGRLGGHNVQCDIKAERAFCRYLPSPPGRRLSGQSLKITERGPGRKKTSGKHSSSIGKRQNHVRKC